MIHYLEWLGVITLTAGVVLIFGVLIYVIAINLKEIKQKQD